MDLTLYELLNYLCYMDTKNQLKTAWERIYVISSKDELFKLLKKQFSVITQKQYQKKLDTKSCLYAAKIS